MAQIARESPKDVAPGKRSYWDSARPILAYLGPAFIVSIAYIDPGNFATDIAAGSEFNYNLLWVILLANLMAILLQILSAKLGIVTGKNLPEQCRDRLARPASITLWIIAEIAAMATDLAEFLGAALGFYLLFNLPLMPAALITGLLSFAILALYRYGFRLVEAVIMSLLGGVGLAYLVEIWLAGPDWAQAGLHIVWPHLDNSRSLYLAIGMIGATVMPHAVYLHSFLVHYRRRSGDPRHIKQHLGFATIETFIAMNLAFLINAAMVIVAAAVFYRHGLAVATIEEAHQTLAPLAGGLSSAAFAVALLLAGLSSSTVGTLAGQVIMQGFIRLRISLWLRRLVTMIPALIVIYLGVEPFQVLVLSQVVLSFALPFAIIPLLLFTQDRCLMGRFVSRPLTIALAWLVAAIIIALNILLLLQTFSGG